MFKALYFSSAFFLLNFFSFNALAQCTFNYLLNPSFETPVQANNYANNFPTGVTFNNWTITNAVPATANPWNIIRVNGSGYTGGPNSAQQGSQYADVNNAAGNMEQNFNLGCAATITFSGYFSSREAGGYTNWTAQINILNSSNAIVASSTTRNFTVADADNNPGDAVWYQVSGTASLPPGPYKFSAVLGNFGNFDNAFLCASPGCLLPVKLSYFGADLENCVVNLKWAAETEIDFNKYIVEYSQNGIDFFEAGSIAGSGSREYSFFHKPSFGRAYYRLRMVDLDGKETFSKIVVLNVNCNKNTLVVYPNPVIDFLNINLNRFITTTPAIASLYDATGRIVLTQKLNNGSNSIDMQKMSTGIYNLVVFDGIQQTNYKIKR